MAIFKRYKRGKNEKLLDRDGAVTEIANAFDYFVKDQTLEGNPTSLFLVLLNDDGQALTKLIVSPSMNVDIDQLPAQAAMYACGHLAELYDGGHIETIDVPDDATKH